MSRIRATCGTTPRPAIIATVAEDLDSQLAEHLRVATKMVDLLPEVDEVTRRLVKVFDNDGRVLTFGNGGSAAEAQHLAGELVGRYRRARRPLAAIALTVDTAVVTCIGNDYAYKEIFARQVDAFARPGDMVIAFTTSGRSPNVVEGLRAARRRGAVSVLLGGGDGGPAAAHADHAIVVPSTTTSRIQEMHLLLLHMLSERLDSWAAGE
jgi:D-sedoheptulose 7-phosphate isomerase